MIELIEPEGEALYVSGPMTGYPEFNYPAFRSCAKALRAQGHRVCDPSEHFGGRTDLPRHKYLAADVVDLVTKCRSIVLLDRWWRSEGAKLEAQIAIDRDYTVYRWISADFSFSLAGLHLMSAEYVEGFLA